MSRGSLGACDRLKRDRIADRDLGEHLAVELDVRRRELTDELRVALAETARGGVDALDPQAAEVPLADLARPVHVHPGVLHGLVRDRVAARPLAAEATGGLQDAVATAAGLESSFSAGHGTSSLLVGQELLD